MGEYVLIMLITLEYDKILSVSDAVHSIRSVYKLRSSYQGRGIFRTLTNIYDGASCQKSNTWVQARNQNFLGQRRICGTGALQ